jgi:hypothetical protein
MSRTCNRGNRSGGRSVIHWQHEQGDGLQVGRRRDVFLVLNFNFNYVKLYKLDLANFEARNLMSNKRLSSPFHTVEAEVGAEVLEVIFGCLLWSS